MKRQRLGLSLLGVVAGLVLWNAEWASSQPLSDAEPVLRQFASEALDTSKPLSERFPAVEALAKWRTAQVRPALLALLEDPNPTIRRTAAQGLGWDGNDTAVPALLARMEAAGEDLDVRTAAVISLGTIGAPGALEPLQALVGDPEPRLRRAAMEGLAFGPLGSKIDQVPVLMALLLDAQGELTTRGRAAQMLGERRDPRSFAALREALERGPRVPPPTPSKKNTHAENVAARLRFMANVRAWSASALGQLGDERALPALTAAVEDREDYFVRAKAMEAIAMLKTPAAIPVLLQALSNPDMGVRYAAIGGLAAQKSAEGVEPLISLLSADDVQLRMRATAALGRIGDARAGAALGRVAATDPDPKIRALAKDALAKLEAGR